MRYVFLKRASIYGALFFLALSAHAANQCGPGFTPDWQTVAYVHDGDTLRLTNGKKIRLIGVNTPELARDGRPHEPLAKSARAFVKRQIQAAGGRIGLIYDAERKDHYGRVLAHVFVANQRNLTQQLLFSGLGSHIAITPNLAFNDCYASAQQSARAGQRGRWQAAQQAVHELHDTRRLRNGFQHIRGTLTRIGDGPDNIWLNFGNKLALGIARQDLKYFSGWRFSSLLQTKLEASGWVYTAKGQQRMRIHHPSVMHVLN